jgi:Yip1-like protein
MTPFVNILFHPQQTIRAIVAKSPSGLVVLPLVFLAMFSASIRDVRWQAYRQSPQMAAMMPSVSVMCAILAGSLLGAILVFYLFAYLVWGIGRFLGGTANVPAVRLALAWSLVPLIWALLYRIPVALFLPSIALVQTHDTAAMLRAAAASLSLYTIMSYALIGVVRTGFDIWCLILAGATLAEVNGFSTWRGAATLGFSLLAPFIIAAAFFISRAG